MLHLTPALTAYILIVTAVLGLVMGSFSTCAAGRMAAGEGFLRGRSHCDACGRVLSPADLIPLLSWLILGGKCRYCGARIPVRCPLMELLCAAAFAGLVLRYDVTAETAEYAILTVLLLTAALVDYDTGLLPDSLLAAMGVNFIAFAVITGSDILTKILRGLGGGAAAAMPLLALVLVMDRLLGKESMGGGDVKLFFAVGLYFSWREALFLLIVSSVLGILFALLCGKRTGDPENSKAFPFGPAIAAGAYLSLLAAVPAVGWYLSLF